MQEELTGSKFPVLWRYLQGRYQEGGWASPREAWAGLGDGTLQTEDEVPFKAVHGASEEACRSKVQKNIRTQIKRPRKSSKWGNIKYRRKTEKMKNFVNIYVNQIIIFII